MLARKNANDSFTKIDSLIGMDAVVVGNLTTGATTRIDGEVQGDIKSKGTLIVGANGKIKGNINAEYIMVAGEVTGDLFAGEKIEVSSSGKIVGNIHTKSLIVDENAMFQGQCVMNVEDGKPEETKTVKSEAAIQA